MACATKKKSAWYIYVACTCTKFIAQIMLIEKSKFKLCRQLIRTLTSCSSFELTFLQSDITREASSVPTTGSTNVGTAFSRLWARSMYVRHYVQTYVCIWRSILNPKNSLEVYTCTCNLQMYIICTCCTRLSFLMVFTAWAIRLYW